MTKRFMQNELPSSRRAVNAKSAIEVLRIWIVDGVPEIIHDPTGECGRLLGVDEEVAWGEVLAETIEHLARWCEVQHGTDKGKAAHRVLVSLESELRAKLGRAQPDL
jgi:hypothetical protein